MRKCERWAKATAKKAPIGRRQSKPISEGSATGSINEREVAGTLAFTMTERVLSFCEAFAEDRGRFTFLAGCRKSSRLF